MAQDESWADRPQEEEDIEAQPTPTPQASSAFRRLRKGPRPQVQSAEIPAASAEDNEEAPPEPTPSLHQDAVPQENVPEVVPQTTNTEANMEPAPPNASADSEATEPDTSVPESAAGPQFDYHIEHRPHV